MSYWLSLLPAIIRGFGLSLTVYIFTLLIALPLGLLLSYLSLKSSLISRFMDGYSWVFRGTPLLLQLYFMFYALPLVLPIALRNHRLFFATLTFILNYTAYFSEIFKGGFKTIPLGQWDAAKMLDMSTWSTLKYIIVPQVFRSTIYSVSNECINLVKDTSLLAAVALPEMLMIAKEAVSRDLKIDGLVMVAIGYLLFTLLVTVCIHYISKKLQLKGGNHDSI